MTLVKKFKKIYDKQHILALFLVFFTFSILSFTHPTINYYLKFLTSYFAYGRSNGQLRLFLIFGCVVLFIRLLSMKENTIKFQHKFLFILLGFQLLSFIIFQILTNQSVLDTSWPTVQGYTSVNAPTHMHVLKPVMHILLSPFLPENFLNQYDSGAPFLSYMPYWWYLIGCVFLLTTTISQIFALSGDKEISILKIICGFGILKFCIDGGAFNSTGVVLIFLYLLEHKLLNKTYWKFLYGIFFITAYYVWISTSSQELESAQKIFIYGIILRGSILWPFTKNFFHGRLFSAVKILSILAIQALTYQTNPWVLGEFFSKNISLGDEIVTLELPEKPWKIRDERTIEIRLAHFGDTISNYQSKILAYDIKDENCDDRIVYFSAELLGIKTDIKINSGPLRISSNGYVDDVMRIKGEIIGCFPLTRGVQNAVLFYFTTHVNEKFIYKNERIWNHPHRKYIIE